MVKCKDCHYGHVKRIRTEIEIPVPITVCKYGPMHDSGSDMVVDPWVSRSCQTYRKKVKEVVE